LAVGAGEERHRIEPLSKGHNRDPFCCGIAELDRYLHEQINQDLKRRVAAPFVLVEPPGVDVLGYYTLSSGAVDLTDWPKDLAKKLPRYPTVPVTLLGRLAVDETRRGEGLGEFLLMDALHKSLVATETVASVAVIVDAINDDAIRFYRHYEFWQFPERPSRLLLPMQTIAQMF
jgi:GNAT superfamily N-acetyltransferase